MTKANRATFLGKVGTTLREYGYKIKYLDEEFISFTKKIWNKHQMHYFQRLKELIVFWRYLRENVQKTIT